MGEQAEVQLEAVVKLYVMAMKNYGHVKNKAKSGATTERGEGPLTRADAKIENWEIGEIG